MRKWLIRFGILIVVVLVANQVALFAARKAMLDRQMSFLDEPDPAEMLAAVSRTLAPWAAELRTQVVPFEEIEPFDDEAHNWGSLFSSYGAGVAIFDANGDGRLDVYFAQNGQNWTRVTDASGLLASKPRAQQNTLYLNQGNDAQGQPRFIRHDVLAAQNDTYVEAELLIEDMYTPRTRTSDPKSAPGRESVSALAADFNGDGRVDLLVGNSMRGSIWSAPETQRVLGRFVNPIGRQQRAAKLPLTSLVAFFVAGYTPTHGSTVTVQTARGPEPEAANSLYLNMGDADGDGLPEWRDATVEAGLAGDQTTTGLVAADFDLDGDLDIYTSSPGDPDYWPGGATGWSGGVNRLWINQLAQTGTLAFVDRAAEAGVDSVYDADYPPVQYRRIPKIPFVPFEYSVLLGWDELFTPEPLVINGQQGANAEISWSTVVQDVDDDGAPDLWVANDLGMLRLFRNRGDGTFEQMQHERRDRNGMWMSFAPGDFNGDLKEDLLVGNMGAGMLNHAFVSPDPYAMEQPVITDASAYMTFFTGEHDPTHTIFDGADPGQPLAHTVSHSQVLPPDSTLPNNIRSMSDLADVTVAPFDPNTIAAYEFAWGMTPFDVQNDGRTDFYWHGGLYSRGGGLFPVMGSDPGRLLINGTAPGGLTRFSDLTAEYHVFGVEEVKYDRLETEGYVYRKAPLQNWNKRDMVYSHDRSAWAVQGVGMQERMVNSDFVQLAENGRAALAADLNNDGFEDLVVTNVGGYDSRRSNSKNLKALIDGRPQVLPSPDQNYPTLTNYDPGRTRVFLNRNTAHNWLKVVLVDDTPKALNRDAIGARIVVNGAHLGIVRAGAGGFIGNRLAPLVIGLGPATATRIEVRWPDKARTQTTLELPDLRRGTLRISKRDGAYTWQPWAPPGQPPRTLPTPEGSAAPASAPASAPSPTPSAP